ncbi:FAD-dependent oxidoreductase [Agarilytica rhodophyticola]|uniref:FAD-dependent oxidoreductase n=1 Tax=Agarilytica rhodophyticola TaxID=1737490 RepID=UPI000B34947A|nr:FAD-dependent oxidoreductase [Agarilytica rhodophyticola]
MQNTYTNPVYPYVTSDDFYAQSPTHHSVVIVGAGPAGMVLAIDLAIQGIPTVVLDDNNTVSVGSRAICFAKRTLEIMQRLGCGQRMVDKGVTWSHGKVFFKDKLIYDFNLLAEADHQLPAFINLQQYYFEEFLVDRAMEFDIIDLRWKSKVISVNSTTHGNEIEVQTPDGNYHLSCDYLIAADGANSQVRRMLGLQSKGQVFQDRFLIADVLMKADFPTERWFWFDPPFHANQSALLHRQPDNVWRIDLQLGWDADPEYEKQEHVIRPRIQAMLGKDAEFDLEWASVYTFQCRKMDNFIHNRVIFVGDCAHQVSPFGARGANGALQSAENLVWKLARVIKGRAPTTLLDTYNIERQHGARENILNSTRATDFITPKNHISRVFRDETLRLAEHLPFARTLVNSGRLSLPCRYSDSPLNSDENYSQGNPVFNTTLSVGTVAKDAPIQQTGSDDWLINYLGNQFTLMIKVSEVITNDLLLQLKPLSAIEDLSILVISDIALPESINALATVVHDPKNLVTKRYDLQHESAYLFRPDQIITARWRQVSSEKIHTAIKKALGCELETAS